MAGFLAPLGASVAMGMANKFLNDRATKQANRKRKRADAFSGLIGSLGGNQMQSVRGQQAEPRMGLMQQATQSQELQKLIQMLLSQQGRATLGAELGSLIR